MAHSETFQATIEINSEKAHARLKELQAEEKKLKDEQKALYAQGTVESKKLADAMQKDINRVSRDIKEETRHVKGLDAALMKISDKTYKDLQQEVRQLNRLMRDGSVKKNSEEWKALAERVKAAKAEMDTYRQAVGEQQPVWKRFFGFLNTNWGAFTQIIGAVAGVTMTVRKSVQDFADMEEAMADTRKYTGLTDAAVRDLNEDLKKMDTRTGREELNALAGSAGRLGIASKEGLLEFVDAADKIKVALGDDLGEGAIDNVGKLAMAFGEDEKMGLRGAMLATGSAVNELAQNSSAQAGFLVDFTARVAGFGKQLGLTQAQIMGFGAVMDENLLRDEMAATAFGNMLTKMQTDTEKFARIAGMSLKEFTDLIDKDANQAVLALADNLKKADPQTMMKMLDDMGLDGSRAVAVLATMADKIDDVRKHQELATRAYEEGKSVIDEYNTMNNTVQAGLDKAKNRFRELSIELGEKLMPVVKYTITGASAMIRLMSVLMDFTFRYKGAIVTAAAAIAAYTAVVKAHAIAQAVSVAATKAATVATQVFNAVLKANPLGLAIAALTAAVALFIKYRDKVDGASEAMGMMRKAAKILLQGFIEITNQIIGVIKWLGSLYDKFGAVRWMVNAVVTAFSSGFASVANSIQLLVTELDGVGKVLHGLFTADWDKMKEGAKQAFVGIADAAKTQFHTIERMWHNLMKVPDAPSRNGGTSSSPDSISEIGEVVVTGKRRNSAPVTYTSAAEQKKREAAEEKARKERLEKLKEADRREKAITDERLAENMLSYSAGLQDYRRYLANQQRIMEEGLKARMAVWGEESNEYKKFQKQLAALQLNGDRELTRQRQADLERAHVILMAQLQKDFNTEGSDIYRNEIAYNEARFREEMAYLEDRKELTREGSLERMQVEWEIEDRSRQHQLESQERFQQLVNDVKSQYLNMGDREREQIELNNLDELHKRGLLKEEEYQRAMMAVKAQYASGQTPGEKLQSEGADALRRAASDAKASSSPGADVPITGTVSLYASTMDQLEQLYRKDEISHEAYLEAKRQATSQFCQDLASQMQAAFDSVNQVMSAASSYYGAQSDYEVAVTKKKYEKQIEAAGNNQKKVKKLQEKQAKEEAAIKTKYNRKQVKIQIAQALAQTATNALNAYGSAAAVPVVGYILAPIAAAMAVAAGMLQVATIKKQAAAQEAGYYEGGFTGGHRYRREAGVVHEGEFVASHAAVNNPNVLPLLQFIDRAQRNNTVGSLTSADISRQLGTGGNAVVAPVVNVQTDNEELRGTIDGLNETISELNDTLSEGIAMRDDVSSLRSKMKHLENLRNRG